MPTAAEEIDRLYGLALDEFTPARDEAAKALRAGGDRQGSEEVKRQRKPSVTAWALNQVWRRDPERVSELLDAGAQLQHAQEQLLSGGDRGLLRDAAARERELVSQLVEVAEDVLAAAGHPAGPTIQNRLRETLHAAAGKSEARELLGVGRLVRDYQMSDLGLPGSGGFASAPPARAKPRADEAKAGAARRRKQEALRRRIEQAQDKREQLEDELASAESAAGEARRELRDAERALERAEAAAERLRNRVADAAARARELERELAAL
jgi:hypothetical protein